MIRTTQLFGFLLFNLVNLAAFSQDDNVGPGRGLTFDGVDDYIELDHTYPALNLPFSVSAWVNLDSDALGSPIFVTNDNNPIYHGFWFAVAPGILQCEFGDGTGGNDPAFRKGRILSIPNIAGRWVHVAAVMHSTTDINMYVNGINIDGGESGESFLTMESPAPGDKAKIGYFLSNSRTYFFKGKMDEVRVWTRALTENEIRSAMCLKLVGNESGLAGYWTFNETSGTVIKDKTGLGNDGLFVGNPGRIFSGAPIGDVSAFSYPPPPSGTPLSLTEGGITFRITKITGNPIGAHVYAVSDSPSQEGGLNSADSNKPYFGAYLASLNGIGGFDAEFDDLNVCKSYTRDNNSIPIWSEIEFPFTINHYRSEFLEIVGQPPATIDLGRDTILCDKPTYVIDSRISPMSASLTWNTGQTTPSITINKSGLYWAETTGCQVMRDSVAIFFATSGTADLGPDYEGCSLPAARLVPLTDSVGFSYTWHDGSHGASFQPRNFGTFWVTAKNACGTTMDSVRYAQPVLLESEIPNVFTPNDDLWNDFFEVPNATNEPISLRIYNRWGKLVFQAEDYKNDWNGGDTSAGVYFLVVSTSCQQVKSTISIIR